VRQALARPVLAPFRVAQHTCEGGMGDEEEVIELPLFRRWQIEEEPVDEYALRNTSRVKQGECLESVVGVKCVFVM